MKHGLHLICERSLSVRPGGDPASRAGSVTSACRHTQVSCAQADGARARSPRAVCSDGPVGDTAGTCLRFRGRRSRVFTHSAEHAARLVSPVSVAVATVPAGSSAGTGAPRRARCGRPRRPRRLQATRQAGRPCAGACWPRGRRVGGDRAASVSGGGRGACEAPAELPELPCGPSPEGVRCGSSGRTLRSVALLSDCRLRATSGIGRRSLALSSGPA